MLIVEHGDNPAADEPNNGRKPARRKDKGGVTFDVLAIIAALVLVVIGLANLWAVDGFEFAARQAAIAVAGVVLLAAFWRFRGALLTALGWVTYLGAVVLLAVVHVAGETFNGATRWIGIGDFTFQPSELAKLGVLLVLAAVLGSQRPSWQRFALGVGLAVVPITFTALQPDLSTTMLLLVLTVSMLIIGRIPARIILPLFAGVIVVAPLVVGSLRPYQLQRLGSFLVGSHESPTGAGWAIRQAHIAVGSGSLFGRSGDPLSGLQAQYLPEKETDLALASVVGQFGLVAGGVVIIAAIVLVWRLALASRVPRSPHGALVAGGLAILIGVEIVVSVGGNLGLLPLAGVPFPLLSFGGTALLVHLAALGVALGVRRQGARRRLWTMPGWRNRRPRLMRTIALASSALLVLFGLYGWNLQMTRGPELAAAGHEQMTRCIRLPAPRGAITDRHGAPLAVSASTAENAMDQVLAVPALVRSRPDDVAKLASLIGQPVDAVRTSLDNAPATTLSLPLADVPRVAGDAVTAAGITGVIVVPQGRRSYPTGALLGPVLGFAGIATPTDIERWPDLPAGEIVGRAGLEQQYDSVLRGVNGRQCVYVSPPGIPVAMGERVEPVRGADLRLSLDLGLQERLSAGLVNALRGQRKSHVGAALAMDPRNGQILALASAPSYDNNVYGPPVDVAGVQAAANAPGHPMLEHATQAALPPGSTFKLVVAAAQMVNPVIPPEKVIPTGGSYTLGGHTFGNWKPMGPMDLVQSIAWSNDVYFYKLANALGPEPIIDAAHALGVGKRTGIDLPGESPGYIGTPESVAANGGTWYGGSTVILGIGQGYLTVTPLQNALFTAGVATGQLVTPRLGLATGTNGGIFTTLPTPAPTPVPFSDKLGPVRDGMRAVVTGGTATGLSGLPFPVGAKTGTAQDGSLSDVHYDNWLSAAAPMPDPRIVMTAVVQGPGSGGNNVKTLIADGLRYFHDNEARVMSTDPMQDPASGR
ncbi:FtsW/RodA/SpoVE family cell cycle protein [Pseudonocardia alaniniphila]|uniref:beta-lactamase n=1 Tax=Pseudonocardia alaniniphila TaxID=75291 RepID=A0ABS9T7X4_9PSEU|nr:FtsW/RodA/SpoVE family cell cycle protein [Pseudonocardia alaniniphila]MCH6164619.1 FtsW/RodA/SpoVE family cell cycle protein [Pseudonocardia alaniniphila]